MRGMQVISALVRFFDKAPPGLPPKTSKEAKKIDLNWDARLSGAGV